MRLFPSIVLLWLVLVDCRAEDADSAPKTVETIDFQFDGVWKPKGAMLRGVLLPPPALKAITLKIEDDHYKVTEEGEDHFDKGMFILDETVTPKRMAIKSMSGPNKGRIFLAIYEVKGENAMRVSYDLSGKAFPKEFKAPKDSDLYLVGYRRQKTTDPDTNRSSAEPKPGAGAADQ